jgi:drug/metabolite transporter (DMT)-like permease
MRAQTQATGEVGQILDKRTILGISLSMFSAFLLTVMFFLPELKHVAASPLQSAFLRYVGGVIALGALGCFPRLLGAVSSRRLDRSVVRLHLFRASIGIFTLTFTLFSASRVPIANVQAILCTHGAIILCFAALIDRAPIGRLHVFSIMLAVFGAILATEPVQTAITWRAFTGYAAAGVAAVCWGLEVFLFRHAAKYHTTILTMLIVNVFGCLVLAVPAFITWQRISAADALVLMAMGPLAVSAQFAQLAALRRAALAIVAPFRYVNVLFATLLGVVFLDQTPSMQSTIGFALIVASAVCISAGMRSRRSQKADSVSSGRTL